MKKETEKSKTKRIEREEIKEKIIKDTKSQDVRLFPPHKIEYEEDIIVKCSIEEVKETLIKNGFDFPAENISEGIIGGDFQHINGEKVFWKKQ